jgi:hypothetical protein
MKKVKLYIDLIKCYAYREAVKHHSGFCGDRQTCIYVNMLDISPSFYMGTLAAMEIMVEPHLRT